MSPSVFALNVTSKEYNYMVSQNGNIKKMKMLKDENNEALFKIKNDDISYNNLNYYEEYTGSLDKELFNKINNIIKLGFIDNNKSDIFYFITQVLIYKVYYNTNDIFMCSSDGTRLTVYDELMNKILDKIKLDTIKDTEIDVFDTLKLDNNYIYDLSNFNNLVPDTYNISYKTKESYKYFYRDDNTYLIKSTSNGYLSGSFTVSVKGVKVSSDEYYKNYLVYDEDILIGSLKDIKYLKSNHNYIIKYNNLVEELNTTNEDIELNKVSSGDESSIIEGLNNIEDLNNIDNPTTNDNILETIIIFISISVIYMLLYIKFRKNC